MIVSSSCNWQPEHRHRHDREPARTRRRRGAGIRRLLARRAQTRRSSDSLQRPFEPGTPDKPCQRPTCCPRVRPSAVLAGVNRTSSRLLAVRSVRKPPDLAGLPGALHNPWCRSASQEHRALGPRVKFAQFDQAAAADWANALDLLRGPPDLTIDDGSHRGPDIWSAFRYLYPRLRGGGLYVIEDLHTSWPKFAGAVLAPDDSAVRLTKLLVDEVQALDEIYARRPDWAHRLRLKDWRRARSHVSGHRVHRESARSWHLSKRYRST